MVLIGDLNLLLVEKLQGMSIELDNKLLCHPPLRVVTHPRLCAELALHKVENRILTLELEKARAA